MRIKEVINEKGLSINELAEKMGVNRVTLCKTVTQNGCNPTVKTLRKIADVLGCDIVDFFSDEVKNSINNSTEELTAFVEYKGRIFKATSKEELFNAIKELEMEKNDLFKNP